MAAPSSAYQTEKLNFDSTTTEIDASLAKFLQNTTATTGDEWGDGYFNSGDSDATLKAKILSIFKLDELLRGYKTDKTGFVGMIRISPSVTTNYAYHSTSRLNGRRIVDATTGNIYDIFTDGGLHTKPFGDLQAILSIDSSNKDDLVINYPPRINNTVAYLYFRSSYYDDTTTRKLYMSQSENSGYSEVLSYGTLSAKSSASIKSDAISAIMTSGDYYFRVEVSNPEGTRTYDPFMANIRMAVATFKYDATYASSAVNGTEVVRYYTTRDLLDTENNQDQATQMFKDETSTPEHTENGFYVIDNMWYKYGYDVLYSDYYILEKGQAQAGGFPSGDPANIVVTDEGIYCNGFDEYNQSTADTEVNSGNYDPRTLYKEIVTNYETMVTTTTYYTTNEKVSYAQGGYYSVGEMVLGVTRQISVGASGVEIYDNIL